MHLRQHLALIGYIALVAVTVLVVQIYQIHTASEDRKIQRQVIVSNYQSCINSQLLSVNQEELVRSVVSLITRPEFKKLGLPQEEMEFVFYSVLTHIPNFECHRPDWYPPPTTDRRPKWWPPAKSYYPTG